jgi:hypothetical protein
MKVEENTSGFLPSARRNKLFVSPEVVDYLLGFVMGTICSIFSFYLLGFFRNKKQKRVGMFWGCILSFVIIASLCVSFAFYTSYVQRSRNEAKHSRGRKLMKLMSFGEYMRTSLNKLLPAKKAKPVVNKQHVNASKTRRSLRNKKGHNKSKKHAVAKKVNKRKHQAKARNAKKHNVKRRSQRKHHAKRRSSRRHHLVL